MRSAEPAIVAGPAASDEAAAPVDACSTLSIPGAGKCSAAKPGRTVTFALKNVCSQDTLEVFWVDEACHEIYRGLLSPSETFWQDSFEGHAFRVRDHVTHQLIKEFSPIAVDGAPDREKIWRGPPTELPVVVLHPEDQPLPEAPPAECTHGAAGRRASTSETSGRRRWPSCSSTGIARKRR